MDLRENIKDICDDPNPFSYEMFSMFLIRSAMALLKKSKVVGADGPLVELFKHGGEVLTRWMHQQLFRTWPTIGI